jgi:hypothetical protein
LLSKFQHDREKILQNASIFRKKVRDSAGEIEIQPSQEKIQRDSLSCKRRASRAYRFSLMTPIAKFHDLAMPAHPVGILRIYRKLL